MGKENRDQGILGGLKAAFVFLTAFMILRYGIPLSIFFATIGGISVGFILSWWQSKEPPQPKRNPFNLKKFTWRKNYPGIKDIPSRTALKGSLNKRKSPEKTSED